MMWTDPSPARSLMSDREVFHRSRQARHGHEIADLHCVFEQEEDAGDEVLHELLGAETDRDADDARAGQQRRNVDADCAEHSEPRNGEDRHGQDRAQHRQKRPEPGGAGVGAFPGELAFDRAVGRFPNDNCDCDGEDDR